MCRDGRCSTCTVDGNFAPHAPPAAGPLDGVSTPAACAQACCGDASCEVWQFCAAGHCAGSAAPASSCYTGQLGSCSSGPGWVSRGIPPASVPYTFHDASGNPVVNTTRFPDMHGMTVQIHALGLTAGWYGERHQWRRDEPFVLCERAAALARSRLCPGLRHAPFPRPCRQQLLLPRPLQREHVLRGRRECARCVAMSARARGGEGGAGAGEDNEVQGGDHTSPPQSATALTRSSTTAARRSTT